MSEYPYRPLVAWMVENKVPDDWADDALIRVDEVCGLIEVEMFMRHPDGGFMIHGGGQTFTEMRTFPMLTPPPPGLLDSYERLRASLREERSAVAALKRQTLDDIIRELRDMGYADAAEWLVSRRLGNPVPARKLVPIRAEAARLGRLSVDGRELTRDCKITIRERARLYNRDGSMVGKLHGCEVDADGVVWLTGLALPMIAQQIAEGTVFPSIDAHAYSRDDNPRALSQFEITSAMVADISAYPWRTPTEGAPDVRP